MENLKLVVTEDEFKDLTHRMTIRTGGDTCLSKTAVKLAMIEMLPNDIVEDESLVEVPNVYMNMMQSILILKHAFKTYGLSISIARSFKMLCAFLAQKKHLNPSFYILEDSYRTSVWMMYDYLSLEERGAIISHSLTFDYEMFLLMNYGPKGTWKRIDIDKSIRTYMINSAKEEGSLIQDGETVMLDYNCIHARRALKCYAMSIKDEQPKLSIRLIKAVDDFELEQKQAEQKLSESYDVS